MEEELVESQWTPGEGYRYKSDGIYKTSFVVYEVLQTGGQKSVGEFQRRHTAESFVRWRLARRPSKERLKYKIKEEERCCFARLVARNGHLGYWSKLTDA